jgi:hypothetical protein
LAAAAYASHLLPFEIMLLSMLVEEHKLVLHLHLELERLHLHLGLEGTALSVPESSAASGTTDEESSSFPERSSHGLHDDSPLYLTDPASPAIPSGMPRQSTIPERKRKWWAGG